MTAYLLTGLAGAFAAVALLELKARLTPPTGPEPVYRTGPLSRERAIELGRAQAQARAGDHRYLEESLTDNQWTPHEWVLLAIEDAYERGAVECPF